MWTTPSGAQKQSSDRYIQGISERPDDFRVLERVPLDRNDIPITFSSTEDSDTTIVIVDVETTGLDHARDSVIELGMVRCRYNRNGTLSGVDAVLNMFEDPGRSIPPEITNLTGITDDMVRGKHVDRTEVRNMLRDDPVMVAHNAAFDRPFFERLVPDEHRWACTLVGIPWRSIGHDTAKLGNLLEREGWFFEAHRAVVDCLATAWLLHVVPGSLHTLLEPSVKVVAGENAYDIKDALKKRGYQWDPANRQWWTIINGDGSDELQYLKDLYPAGYGSTRHAIDPRTAFKGSRPAA